MAMDWTFETGFGAVTVKQEGEQILCQAIGPLEGSGLYKAWLCGPSGKALLGTLIPEGGALRLRRTLSLSQLKAQGAWPPTGAQVAQSSYFIQPLAPHGWQWTDCPSRLLGEQALSRSLQGVSRALLRRTGERFYLAFPRRAEEPFPIPALFCLASVEQLGEGPHYVFCFSRRGRPEVMYDLPDVGNTTSETKKGGKSDAQSDRKGVGWSQ